MKKIAIVYDWIDSWGGVERVLLELHNVFPHAHFYTSYVDLQTAAWAKDLDITSSFIQHLPNILKKSRVLSLPLYPYAFESFNFSDYDLVLSVSSAFAKSVITKPATKHICYLLTPPRYLWGMTDEYKGRSSVKATFAAPLLGSLRRYDYLAAQRVDHFIAISQAIADRCQKYYQREADVLFPPFDIGYWKQILTEIAHEERPLKEQYHLVVSRLEPYKNVELPISLFNKTKKHLVIIGKGTQKQYLQQQAGNTITFVDTISDQELARWYKYAEALIMPQEEDFGYVSLEAQIMGCPVVAYAKGGACETIIINKTGVFFASQSEEALQEALERLASPSYNGRHTLQAIEPFLESFSKDQFLKRLTKYVSDNL